MEPRTAFERALREARVDFDEDDLMHLSERLEELGEALEGVLHEATLIRRDADRMGGEIKRVVGGQLQMYFIGNLESYSENENQPGSVPSLLSFIEDHAIELRGRGEL